MITMGLDNGIAGAIASYNSETSEIKVYPMPIITIKKAKGNKNEYNLRAIINIIKAFGHIDMAIIERAHAFPGQGVVSMFNIGRGFGMLEGILAALDIPYMIVHSKTWQKKMFEGMPHADTKQASIVTAQRLFPGIKLFASDKATKLHNGMSDAALMAYYGYLLHI